MILHSKKIGVIISIIELISLTSLLILTEIIFDHSIIYASLAIFYMLITLVVSTFVYSLVKNTIYNALVSFISLILSVIMTIILFFKKTTVRFYFINSTSAIVLLNALNNNDTKIIMKTENEYTSKDAVTILLYHDEKKSQIFYQKDEISKEKIKEIKKQYKTKIMNACSKRKDLNVPVTVPLHYLDPHINPATLIEYNAILKFLIKKYLKKNGYKNFLKYNKSKKIEKLSISYKNNTYCGLKNLGATCYFNSFIQTIFHITEFRKKIYECRPFGIIKHLQNLFYSMENEKVSNPEDLARLIIDNVRIHEDINEFSLKFFDVLSNETNNKTIYEALDLLTGTIKETRMENDKQVSENSYPFKNIFLPISNSDGTIIDNLQESLIAEFTNDNKSKKEIEKAPEILFLLINRFIVDKKRKSFEKYNGLFKYPLELDISSFCVDKTTKKIYRLHSVILHKGGVAGGHYVCNILIDGVWYNFNDEIVTVINEEEATKRNFGGPGENSEEIGNFTAYYLIYVKKELK
ncbi:ubiquitin carboxyl-terminal hydrolase 7 [Vairimorpha necatrix]|uniref:Ubiquitin carboxyl-terminal hydrolase n=1 Tax=Vairimorpha necatrix TaxID=6039 RepID=A0AAX4JG49_9MICR